LIKTFYFSITSLEAMDIPNVIGQTHFFDSLPTMGACSFFLARLMFNIVRKKLHAPIVGSESKKWVCPITLGMSIASNEVMEK